MLVVCSFAMDGGIATEKQKAFEERREWIDTHTHMSDGKGGL